MLKPQVIPVTIVRQSGVLVIPAQQEQIDEQVIRLVLERPVVLRNGDFFECNLVFEDA